jgi:formylglycine-generating enzyme required for sulfatase activity
VGALPALGCGHDAAPETSMPSAAAIPPGSEPAGAAANSEAATSPGNGSEKSGPCPADMELVEGRYCLAPEQRCVDPPDGPNGGKNGANHCLRYAEPSTCFEDRRKPLRYCMDRFEWPNQKGAMPMVLVSWEDARQICASVDKRLCSEEEFNFACEGEAMRPYVYGFARDTSRCNFDKPYRERTFTFLSWGFCLADPDCREAFAAIDQRLPSGSMEGCRSDDGVFDLNGNVNEWVMIPGNRPPHRSGIKGGWWGPVRNRCRPTVTFHDEGDFGYEVGFRCCADIP